MSVFPQNSTEPIRITLLSRGTKFRKILNENEVRDCFMVFSVMCCIIQELHCLGTGEGLL